MTDQFEDYGPGLTGPIQDSEAVPASGDYTFAKGVTRAIYVGTAGDVQVVWKSGGQEIIKGLAAGIWHPMRVKSIKDVGTTTTAVDIQGGY